MAISCFYHVLCPLPDAGAEKIWSHRLEYSICLQPKRFICFYEIYSKSSDERLYGCKREGKKLLDKGWEETGSTDSEDTPLLIYPPHKYKSEKGIHTYIYNSIETGEPIVKVVRTDDGEGNKSFAQYSKKNGNWLIGTRYIEKSDIALYNSESFHNLF